LADAKVDVAVDFTVADAARVTLPWLALHGVHAVVGTTGFTDADLAAFRQEFTRSNCLIAPNFAIGAVLMMRFAEIAAPFFDTAEIIEIHHDRQAHGGCEQRVGERPHHARSHSRRTWRKGPR
jgi:4-hydroxy-tetrahydrodipicolinate reductase